MLNPATPFPQVGSYALFIDLDQPVSQQHAELVRILRRQALTALVAFPLREGASGNKTVPLGDLIDGTPLAMFETREFHTLDRALRGIKRPNKGKAARRDALKDRMQWAPILKRKIDQAERLQARKVAA